MDFPSFGVARTYAHGQGNHHQPSYRNTPARHTLFCTPNPLFGGPNFGNGSSLGSSGNQFNFPLRSRPGGRGGYSSLSGSQRACTDGVLRQSVYGASNLQPVHFNKNQQRPSTSGPQNNSAKSGRFNGNVLAQNGKSKDKVEKEENTQQQYRIFKRGDIIPGVSSPRHEPKLSPDLGVSQGVCGILTSPELKLGSLVHPESSPAKVENGVGNCDGSISAVPSMEEENQKNNSTTGKNTRTTVSLVSEIAKFHGLQLEYRLVKETGPPHAPTFTVSLTLGTEEYEGCGSSIKRAQNAAATEAIENTSFLKPPPRSTRRNYTAGANNQKKPNWALIQLTSLAEQMKQPLHFALQPMAIADPFYKREPPTTVTVHVGSRVFTGEGQTFNSAKNTAAIIALKTLQREKQEAELTRLFAEGTAPFQLEERSLQMENKSPISVVHEMAMKRNMTASFDVTNESGPPHMKVFTVKCSVGDMDTEGQGSTKQQAKKISSEMMISKLRELQIPIPSGSGISSTLKAIQRGYVKPKITKRKSAPIVKVVDKHLSPISKLIQVAHSKKFKEPEFRCISQSSEPSETPCSGAAANKNDRRNKRKKTLFTVEVSVGSLVCQGTGMNKKSAKKAAADLALVTLGCAPSSPVQDEPEIPSSSTSTAAKPQSTVTSSLKDEQSSSPTCSPSKTKQLTTTARQLAPGIFVLKNEESHPSPPTQSSAVAHELMTVNKTLTAGPSSQEGTEKLNYLAHLLDLKVSFSDFPKKNEFLSIVSLGSSPPHVAHGVGLSLEEARNMAAQKILDDLADSGLDSVTSNSDTNSRGANNI